MVRDLRFLAAFAVVSLLTSVVFFPLGCASSGASSIAPPSGDDASTATGDGATRDAAGDSDGPSGANGCQSNADCATSPKGHVCVSGTCEVCGANADCPTGEKCDAHTSCVACLTSADCAADQRCVNNACAMGCDTASTCPTGTLCDTTTSVCVGCLKDTDCSAPTAKCDTTSDTCVACLATSDCAAGTVCNANACVPGCSATQPCPTGEVCNAGACVQCTVNSQCHGATPWCDTTSDTCVQCLPSNDNCPTGQYCAATACAPGCKSNLDCVALADGGAGDAGGDAGGGGGTGGGTTCDTTNHVCVGCLVDANCPLGQTCSNSTCVAGCDASHGCPAGSACCTGLCQPLNTVSNCTGCGITCDTTSGNSQGAACGPGGCTYTGCAAGWGDCSSASPDSDGCETNLNGANERACPDGTCVPKGTCCSASDCTTPPTPTSCFPAAGVCASEGATCSYPQNAGSVICTGTTCCNPINGTCNNDCSPDCAAGFGHCTGDPSNGCETNTGTDTADCGGCARACSGLHATALSCSNGECNSTCAPGWGNCSTPLAPAADDGCESNLTTCYGTPCCAAGDCADPHPNGAGENYDDCNPLGTPGTASTYTAGMAEEAAVAYGFSNPSYYTVTCNGGETAIDICNATASKCYASWCYTGACAGYLLLEPGGIGAYCPAGATATSWK